MKQISIFTCSILLLTVLSSTKILAQSPAAAPAVQPSAKAPPAQAPSGVQVKPSPGPLDVVKILGKASHFGVLVRLLKSTQVDSELFLQLNNTNNGATIFAPTDGAFSSLKTGTLNELSDGDKIELVKFHIVPNFLSTSQFQTVSNPVRTLAGAGNRFALNVTTGDSTVNITTGLTNTTISGTVYTDSRLAIYQVDKVLLPLDVFTPKPPAPVPAPAALAPEKPTKAPLVESPVASNDDASSAEILIVQEYLALEFLAVGVATAMFLV